MSKALRRALLPAVFLFCLGNELCAVEKVVVDIGSQYYSPTRAVVTPHIPWANPYALGKLRVLFIGERTRMREVIEIAQRLEIDYAFFGTRGKKGEELFQCGYFRRGYYKGDKPGDKKRRLRSLLSGSDYDLIVFGSIVWGDIPLFARYEILRQVKNGAGLLNIERGSGGKYLGQASRQRISVPLTVAEGVPWKALPVFSRYKDTADFLESTLKAYQFCKGRIVTIRGYKLPMCHLISPGFTKNPLESRGDWAGYWNGRSKEYKARFPEFDMPIEQVKLLDYDYNLAFIIKVMLFAAQKEPPVTVRGGERREGTASPTLAPVETGRPRPAGLIHEVDREDLSLVSFHVTAPDTPGIPFLTADFALRDRDNDVLATSHKAELQLRPGDNTVSFPVSGVPAGEYFADLWIKRDSVVLGFGSQALRVTSKTRIKAVRLASEYFGKDERIGVEVEIEGVGDGVGDSRLEIRQEDSHGRLVRKEAFDVPDSTPNTQRPTPNVHHSTLNVNLEPVPDPLTVYQFLNIDLVSGGTVLDRHRLQFTLSDLYLTDTIRIGAWQTPLISYLSFHLHDQLYKAGFDSCGCFCSHSTVGRDYFGAGPNSTFKRGRFEIPVLANLRYIPPCARINDVGIDDYKSVYLDTKQEQPLKRQKCVRYPCLHDPKYVELMQKRVKDVVEHHGKASTSDYMFDQEICFTQFCRKQDGGEVCYCSNCKEFFRKYLKREYGSIEAVNAEYGTSHTDVSSIEPVKLDQALKDRRLWPLWTDYRMAMDSTYSGFLENLTEIIRSLQPEAIVGDAANSDGYCSFFAVDTWKFSRWRRMVMHCGSTIEQDFALPGSLMGGYTQWGPANARGREYATKMPWSVLFQGFNFYYTYWGDTGATLLAHDLSPYEDLKCLLEEYREIKQGIGKLLHEAEREHNGVAVLYSIASVHHWTLTTGRVRATGGIQKSYKAWEALLTDVHGPFRFVSYEQVAQGILAQEGFKLLVLPYSQALSPSEIKAIKAFVRQGGVVLADLRPGVSDGHCKAYPASPLDEVFGAIQNTTTPGLKNNWVSLPLAGNSSVEPLGRLLTDGSLRLGNGGQAAHSVGDVPLLVTHQFGKGKGILLNFSVNDYLVINAASGYDRSVHGETLRSFLRSLLESTALERPVRLSPELKGLCAYTFRSGGTRHLGLLQEMPEPMQNYAAGTAAPLITKRTTVSFDANTHIYDSRTKRYLGFSDKMTTHVTPGIAQVFSLVPYRVGSIDVTVPAEVEQGDRVPYEARIAATETPEKHVLHISLIGPDGKAIRWYTKNVECTGGKYAGELTLALDEKPGTYELSVTDAATGVEGRAGVEIVPRGL